MDLRIVDSHGDLEPGGQIGQDTRNKANQGGSRRADITGGRGDGNKTCDHAGTETDDTPFALESEIHNHPDDTSDTSGQVGVEHCHGSSQVGGECRTTAVWPICQLVKGAAVERELT